MFLEQSQQQRGCPEPFEALQTSYPVLCSAVPAPRPGSREGAAGWHRSAACTPRPLLNQEPELTADVLHSECQGCQYKDLYPELPQELREDEREFSCCSPGLEGSWGMVQPQPGEEKELGEILLDIQQDPPWERHPSSGAQPDSLSDLFWLLWVVLHGSALLSLPRDWDVLPCLGTSLPASLLPSPLLPSWQKFLFCW